LLAKVNQCLCFSIFVCQVANNVHVRPVTDRNSSYLLSGCGIFKLYHIELVSRTDWDLDTSRNHLSLKVHGAS